MATPKRRPKARDSGPVTSNSRVLRVSGPAVCTRCVPVNTSPRRLLCQLNSCPGSIRVTVQVAVRWPGCLIRAWLPTRNGPSSSRSTGHRRGRVGQRSTSMVRSQISSAGASIMTVLVHFIPRTVPFGTCRRRRQNTALGAGDGLRRGGGNRRQEPARDRTGAATSHRMLLYHFGSREGLLAAIVAAVEASSAPSWSRWPSRPTRRESSCSAYGSRSAGRSFVRTSSCSSKCSGLSRKARRALKDYEKR